MIFSKFYSLMSFYASLAQPFPTFYTKSHSTSVVFTACAHLQREERSAVITFLESINIHRKTNSTGILTSRKAPYLF